MSDALHTKYADQISSLEQKDLDSLFKILRDRVKLTHNIPKHRQYINCLTRENDTLDYHYNIIKDAYHSVLQAALVRFNYCLVNFILTYRQNFLSAKPVVKTVMGQSGKAETTILF